MILCLWLWKWLCNPWSWTWWWNVFQKAQVPTVEQPAGGSLVGLNRFQAQGWLHLLISRAVVWDTFLYPRARPSRHISLHSRSDSGLQVARPRVLTIITYLCYMTCWPSTMFFFQKSFTGASHQLPLASSSEFCVIRQASHLSSNTVYPW